MESENLPKQVASLTKHSELLRTTLADPIESVAHKLNGRFTINDKQLKGILETAKTQPEDGVSQLIGIIKGGSQKHFHDFIQCLNDMGYTGLVEKLTENLPKQVASLTKHSELLRTTLADPIESVAHKLNGRSTINDKQLKGILETAKTQPEDGVSQLIGIIKGGSQKHFHDFIQCLNDMGYTGLVEKLTETITENNKKKRPTPEQKPAKKKKRRKAGYKKDYGDSTINRIETHSNIENPSEIHQLEQIADLPNRFDDADDNVQSDGDASNQESILDIIPAIHSNEPMHENDRHKIQKHMSYLVAMDIDPLKLIIQLHSLFVFDKDEFNDLSNDLKKRGKISCMAMMLAKLYDKGTNSYIHFLLALERCNYTGIIKKLEPDCEIYEGRIKYNGQFLELTDLTGDKYKEFVKRCEKNIEDVYHDHPGQQFVVVKKLAKGCVEVTFHLISLGSNNREDLRRPLQDLVNSGFINTDPVKPGEIYFRQITDEELASERDSMTQKRIIVLENEIETLKLHINELLIDNAELKTTAANSQEMKKYQEHLAKKYTDTLQEKEQIICRLQEQLDQQATDSNVDIDRTDDERHGQDKDLAILPTDDDPDKDMVEKGEDEELASERDSMNQRRIIVLENEIESLELQKNELLIKNAALKATSTNSQEMEKYQEHLAKKYTDTLQDKEQIICILQEQLGQQAIDRHVNIDRTDGKRLVQDINLTILPTDDDHDKDKVEKGEGTDDTYDVIDEENKGMAIPEIRVSIIGKTGVGKSALGNALLQQETFKSQQQTTSVTSECGSGKRLLQLNGVNTSLKVVDTPGLFDTGSSNKAIAKEIVKCINLLSPGPHLFIMVFRIDYRLSQEDIKVLEYFKNTFGELIDKFAVVVLTGKDQLDNRSEEDALRELHTQLSTFSDVFKHRRFAMINNKDTTEGKAKDVDRILQLLQSTIQNNGGDFYKNEMFEEAKKLFEARIHDEEEDKQKALVEIDQLKKERDIRIHQEQIWQKEKEQLMKQWSEEREKFIEDKRNKEIDLDKMRIQLLERERQSVQLLSSTSRQSYTEVASTSTYQHGSSFNTLNMSRPKKRKYELSCRERGKMLQGDEKHIQSNFTFLLENITEPERLSQCLFSKSVFDMDDMDTIKEIIGKRDKTNELLTRLLKGGSNAYQSFIESLNEEGYKSVVEQLESSRDERHEEISGFHGNQFMIRGMGDRHQLMLGGTDEHYDVSHSELGNRSEIYNEHSEVDVVKVVVKKSKNTVILSKVKSDNQKVNVKQEIISSCQRNVKNIANCVLYENHDSMNNDVFEDEQDYSEVDVVKIVVKKFKNTVIVSKVKSGNQKVNVKQEIISSCQRNVKNIANCVLYENHDTMYNDVLLEDKQDTDDTYDHSVIDEENKGMIISDDKTTYKNIMDVESICETCRYGTLDDVTNLILHNIDLNIRDERGRTPLFHCVISRNQPVEKVKLLVSTGAMLDVKNTNGYSLLHYACWWGTIDSIKYLLEQGLDKDGRDYFNRTPLFDCVRSDYQPVEKVKFLVSTGAMLDVKDKDGCSLLDFARLYSRECESYLRELGLDK